MIDPAPPVAALDDAAQAAFDAAVRAIGRDPADPWIGGYVAYEWRYLRANLAAYEVAMQNADGSPCRVLEFGCNVGASAIVMAALGAVVTGVDIDPAYAAIARANVTLHGFADRITITSCADTRRLPFADGSFDFILANSVLEYVPVDQLDGVLAELQRVCAPGGTLLVTGTASRLAPREIHSRRWLVNYWPSALDRLVAGVPLQRGLSPLLLARTMRDRFTVIAADRWLNARRAVHGRATIPMRLVAGLARMIGIAPGWISPHIELLARRMG